MEKIHKVAIFCIGRAVMFGVFAIGLVMLSFSFDLVLAFSAGALMTLIMSELLILKAYALAGQNPKKTEVWIHLSPDARPVGQSGAKVFITILKDIYLRFAVLSLQVGCGFFAFSMMLRLMRAIT
ncbi:hypothetical protein [uncultured Nitratireductor sp.]|uniref:hypothetical protein n=1 Tax=uncultured Nitratireductor sp. TaxID=520953 RepID=UPI0025DA3136|nr:hypothetical protein [uncultured Nitratireductor sp.]